MSEKMRAVQVPRAGGEFELVEREIPEPPAGWVRVRVEACGICHSDVAAKEGRMPGIEYPRVPGHEVAGRVDRLGAGVTRFQRGQRVGVGWHGGHCLECEACRAGDFKLCANVRITGIHHDGGYAEYMLAPATSVAVLPEALDAAEAAPLLCAGITTYNALRHSGARAGDVVAIQGIGGLGHLAVQFARKAGYTTVAISSGAEKKEMALGLGADHYIDAARADPAEELQRLGGARVILSTVPHSEAITPLVKGLGRNGELVVVAASTQPLEIPPVYLVQRRAAIRGWASGHPKDAEDTARFSLLNNVRARIETYPLERAAEAYARVMNNEARFRAVLKIAS